MFQVTTGALQGIGQTAIPLWNMAAGAVLKAIAVRQLPLLGKVSGKAGRKEHKEI